MGRASKAPQISTGVTAKTPATLQLEKKQLQAQLKTYGERIGTFLDGLATQAGTPREIKGFLQMVKMATKTHVSVGRIDAFGKLALSYHPIFSRPSTLTTLSKPTSTLTTTSYSAPLTYGDGLLSTPSHCCIQSNYTMCPAKISVNLTDIYIFFFSFHDFFRESSGRGSEMINFLMAIFWTQEELALSSLTGGNHKQLDSNLVNCICGR